MRKFLKIALMVSFMALAFACAKDEPAVPAMEVTPNNISGTWKLQEINGTPVADGLFMYLELIRRDKKFAFHENISGSQTVVNHRTGRFDIFEGDVITFLYDGSMSEYGKKYQITELTENKMVWVREDDKDEISVYVRCESIPEL